MRHALVITIVGIAAAVAVGCSDSRISVDAAAAPNPAAARVERGKYLVSVVGCNDCHTPFKLGPKGPEPDMSRFLSGHPEQMGALPPAKAQGAWLWAGAATNTAFSGPWGISYAANLTPDQNTGLGIWTEEMFVNALRTGRHMGTSREILPPMPWPALRNASDEDLKSMFAYLRTIKPIVNHVPDAQVAAPVATSDAK
jgi:mono/diheme cytochrome c family protein